MNLTVPVNAILVPQGAEYKSVCRGLSHVKGVTPPVFPIPIGSKSLTEYLKQWQQTGYLLNHPQQKVLLMGLCGSLTSRYSVGDIVLCKDCVYKSDGDLQPQRDSDRVLTDLLYHKLKTRAYLGKFLTSDRLIYSASEKLQLGQSYNAEVVDMEGFAALKVLSEAGVGVAMVRVVSDDTHHDLPNITSAISPDGSLQSLPLAVGMLRQPLAAIRLIRGSLRGLKILQELTTHLFSTQAKGTG